MAIRRFGLCLVLLLPLFGAAQGGENPAPEGCPACPVEFRITAPSARRARIARRVGSARAAKVASSCSSVRIKLTDLLINLSV